MTLTAFLAAVPNLVERYVWYEDDLGQLRGVSPGNLDHEYTTMTALAREKTGIDYDPLLHWEQAANDLGLDPQDAAKIVSAEDMDRHAGPVLGQALRSAVCISKK